MSAFALPEVTGFRPRSCWGPEGSAATWEHADGCGDSAGDRQGAFERLARTSGSYDKFHLPRDSSFPA